MSQQRVLQAAFISIVAFPIVAFCGPFTQTNLTSSVMGLAANFDPNLKNPWGISYSVTSPIWVSDQLASVATLYNGAGGPQALVVTIPSSGPPQGPTGQVFNSAGAGNFVLPNGTAASFLFATLGGNVEGWNGG